MMKYIYFINRFSLKEDSDRLIAALERVCGRSDRDYEIVVSNSIAEHNAALERFKEGGYILCAIGGDGSINLLLNDIVKTDNVLSFIPYGTGNDFYRYCKESGLQGQNSIDLIRINERYFLNVACFGIDADIANDDNFIHNRFIPRPLRYDAGVVYYFLTYKPRKMRIEINGELIERKFTTLVAANARYYGGGYRVSPYKLQVFFILNYI